MLAETGCRAIAPDDVQGPPLIGMESHAVQLIPEWEFLLADAQAHAIGVLTLFVGLFLRLGSFPEV
jgi:hypothetical protein